MEGLELLEELAEIERELAEKLHDARGSAESRIKAAEEEGQRILAEADAEIRQMSDRTKDRRVKNEEKAGEKAQARAEAAAESIERRAAANIDKAVEYILSKVLP